jgi:hypothetical protein
MTRLFLTQLYTHSYVKGSKYICNLNCKLNILNTIFFKNALTKLLIINLCSSRNNSGKKASVWTEHKAGDNRIYYYNSITKQSSWEKPDELKTPAEARFNNAKKKFILSPLDNYF